jgi:two-component system, NtrC family, sensor histidine kinase AtoS
MKLRFSLIISVFLLVVTPIIITGLVTMETAEKVLQAGNNQTLLNNSESVEINRVRENIVYLFIIGTVLSLTGAGIFATNLANSVTMIKTGLDGIGRDPAVKLQPMRGFFGAIADAINDMADKLRETRGHRDALLDSSPNGIISVDKQGKIILFNPAASALTGVAGSEAMGLNFSLVGLATPLVSLLSKTLERQATEEPQEEILQRPDSSTVAVAVSTAGLFDQLGEVVGALAVIIDLREKRLLEAQVLRANRLAGLGELAAGIAHEIRNPLTAVKGFSQILEEELPNNDEKREYTAVIIKEVNRLEKIVQGLLAFARPARSKFRRENLAEIMDETLLLVENGLFKGRIEVIRDYDLETCAEVDKGQMKQVFLNLLLNAGQSIQGSGSIEISVRRVDAQVLVAIRDSGCGISDEHADKLFNPFFTTRENGTGLGLAIVHQLVEIHGGRVKVNSKIAKGTEFVVYMPVQQRGDA